MGGFIRFLEPANPTLLPGGLLPFEGRLILFALPGNDRFCLRLKRFFIVITS
ncbi:hypothetical protein Back11_00260 [Paenibacillus baekrokdamisoli]|uniref:Uncharacterized protein n=1 Tax=Paenibacillus baekrokdamisoli TaxID=1712516 RepID=A0A3G9IYD0_9BACL|nr:hypothetical protein [Paenibacillus baekrokdamisoli]MBB3069349.1 hypothetical protein [Paenibacillus baekrokdamisoli]BBH18681.1 hypothetical protein Back11_00260 [Paenibacillus baekrokdamisoli]